MAYSGFFTASSDTAANASARCCARSSRCFFAKETTPNTRPMFTSMMRRLLTWLFSMSARVRRLKTMTEAVATAPQLAQPRATQAAPQSMHRTVGIQALIASTVKYSWRMRTMPSCAANWRLFSPAKASSRAV